MNGPMQTPLRTAVGGGWCLRFLSGALKGRTIALQPGTNVLGSGADCEVMLPGGDVQPRHLVLHVGELVLSAQKIGTAEAALNGEAMQQQRRSVVAGDVLTIGRIEFQLDRSLPVQPQDDPMFADGAEALPGEAAGQALQAGAPGRSFYWGAGLLAVALAGLLGLAMVASRPAASHANAGVRMAEVQKALASFPEVEVVAAPGGVLQVKGFVESRSRQQALAQALQPYGAAVRVSTQTAEDLVEQARRYVADPGVALSYVGNGRLVASGASDNEALRDKLRRLAEDLHPTVQVMDKVQYRPPQARAGREADLRSQWAAWQGALPGRLVSITEDGSGLRHIQLSNGTRYYEGAVLKSGTEIEQIDTGGLVLRGVPPAEGEGTRRASRSAVAVARPIEAPMEAVVERATPLRPSIDASIGASIGAAASPSAAVSTAASAPSHATPAPLPAARAESLAASGAKPVEPPR